MSFTDTVIRRILADRQKTVDGPNVDTWRFPPTRGIAGYNPETALHTIEAVLKLAPQLNAVAALYQDQASVDLMGDLIAFRALGHARVKLPSNTEKYWGNFKLAETLRVRQGTTAFPPFETGIYKVPFDGGTIEVECWLGNVVYTFLQRQYYFSRTPISIVPSSGDYVLDGGACFGDTALAFATSVGARGKVFSFDPMPAHQTVIHENLQRNSNLADRVNLVPYALWDQPDVDLNFMQAGAGSRPSGGGIPVKTTTIDATVQREKIERVDFIKLDIEGSEERALWGALSTIRKFKPKLAISIYHNFDDLTKLPTLIKAIEPSYKLYLDHYTTHLEESILYATTEDASFV